MKALVSLKKLWSKSSIHFFESRLKTLTSKAEQVWASPLARELRRCTVERSRPRTCLVVAFRCNSAFQPQSIVLEVTDLTPEPCDKYPGTIALNPPGSDPDHARA